MPPDHVPVGWCYIILLKPLVILFFSPTTFFITWEGVNLQITNIAKVHHSISHNLSSSMPLIESKKYQAQLLGCSFLGSQAVQIPPTVNFLNKNFTKVITDFGSNITLLLQKSVSEMQTPIKVRQKQQAIK